MRKQGAVSETGHVAVLIVIIALLMLTYFVLLPSEEKEELLGIKAEKEGITEINLILAETPGHVYPFSKETEEKRITSFSLFSQVKTAAVSLASRIHTSRNIFTGQSEKLNFVLDDLGRIKSLGLLFNIVKAKGDLVVFLNEQEIFRGEIVTGDLPIDLPVSLLKVNNELKIYASNPGWRFLSTNYYDLKDVQLIKRYSEENKFESRDFLVYDREKVKRASLKFYANCMDIKEEQGHLNINVNNIGLLSGRVSCVTDKIDLDIDKSYLRTGKNILTFEIDKGNYMFEQIFLNLIFEKEYYPEYYFVIDEKEGNYELKMDFAEKEIKRASIMLNGKDIEVAEEDLEYVKDVTGYLKEGENYLKIVPKNEFTITNLEIMQEK